MTGYKKFIRPARKALFPGFLLLWIGCHSLVPARAGVREDAIARATIAQVRAKSRRAKSLEALGKQTLSESAAILDLGPEALPVIHETFLNKKEDWKVRYWALDMLGYVGNRESSALIQKMRRGEKNRVLRKKIGKVLAEIKKKG